MYTRKPRLRHDRVAGGVFRVYKAKGSCIHGKEQAYHTRKAA